MQRIHRRRRASILLTIAALTALGLGACSFPDSDATSKIKPSSIPAAQSPPAGTPDPATQAQYRAYYTQRADWSSCGGGFQCTKIRVPLDWSQPQGEQIQIAVNKLPAKGKRIGSMVVNPGGPGASGLTYAQSARQLFSASLLKYYDVVGFDPRGIGASDPVHCLPNSSLDAYFASDGTPDTAAELTELVDDQRAFGQACQKNSGALLAHVDSVSTAKDLDVLRAVLGDDVLSYFGASYGTYLGAWYAQLFPWRVGRMTLDGAVDPTLTSDAYAEGQAQGFQRALKAFVRDCQSQDDCPVRGTVDQGLDQIGQLVAKADQTPLRTKDPNRPLTQSLMTTGIAQGMYATQLWPILTIGLTNAMAGDGTQLLALADEYLDRNTKGQYGQINSANPAIYCLDLGERQTPQQIAAFAAGVQAKYPPLGGYIGWSAASCAEWPYPAVVPRQKLTADGAPPILVLGTIDDPATPYEWAQGLASQLSSGHLVTWAGTVHTAYRKGSECVDGAVDTYMLTGAVPAPGLRCP